MLATISKLVFYIRLMEQPPTPPSQNELNAALAEMAGLAEEILANSELSAEERNKLEQLLLKLKQSK